MAPVETPGTGVASSVILPRMSTPPVAAALPAESPAESPPQAITASDTDIARTASPFMLRIVESCAALAQIGCGSLLVPARPCRKRTHVLFWGEKGGP